LNISGLALITEKITLHPPFPLLFLWSACWEPGQKESYLLLLPIGAAEYNRGLGRHTLERYPLKSNCPKLQTLK
jgi:hypothetical protein